MPSGMAYAIYAGSIKSVLTIGSAENDYQWVARFAITTAGPSAGTWSKDVVINGADAAFDNPVESSTLTFNTNDIIEVDNDESIDEGNWIINNLTVYIRELGQTNEQVVIPQTSINVTIEPLQSLRITEIKLQVNE